MEWAQSRHRQVGALGSRSPGRGGVLVPGLALFPEAKGKETPWF